MNEIKINSSCRTCLKENIAMRPLTTKWNNSNHSFWTMLIELLNFENIQGVPFNICDSCELTLITSYSFRKMCVKTENILKELVSTNKIELENEPMQNDEIEECIWIDETFDDQKFVNNNLNLVEPSAEDLIQFKFTELNEDRKESENETEENDEYECVEDTELETKEDVEKINSSSNSIPKELTRSTNESLKKKTSYLCRFCNIKFNNHNDYQCHYRQTHRTKIVCPLCGKLVLEQYLEKHNIIHTKVKNHLCIECGKSFTLKENLQKHLRIHSGEKKYKCEYCDKKFIHWNSKRSHIRAFHTGEKNYNCYICEKKFAQKGNLQRHIHQHTGELPHECQICTKKFLTTTQLRLHMVIHTKEKNEICDVCQKAFGTRKAKMAHTKIHTGERNYVCVICKKAFTQAHVLRTHMKTHPDCPIPPHGARLSQRPVPQKNLLASFVVRNDKEPNVS